MKRIVSYLITSMLLIAGCAGVAHAGPAKHRHPIPVVQLGVHHHKHVKRTPATTPYCPCADTRDAEALDIGTAQRGLAHMDNNPGVWDAESYIDHDRPGVDGYSIVLAWLDSATEHDVNHAALYGATLVAAP